MAAARDPNKLEPAYLITLAIIVGLPVCCSYLNRGAAPPPKMSIPVRGTWTVTMDDGKSRSVSMNLAMQDGKWRMESRNREAWLPIVAVHDGQRSAANPPESQASQLELLNPVKQLQPIALAFNRHPLPDTVSLDGVLCWHAKVREGDDETETWLDAKTGFPKRFIVTRGDGRVMAQTFENFNSSVPNDQRVFDVTMLEPMLKP
jgi:hypothetical protein